LLFTGSALALLIVSSAAIAQDESSAPPPEPTKWGPELQLESDIGIGHNARDIGLPQIMAPLWQNNDSMVFTDLRFRFDNEQSQEYNIGLGYRKEINSDWILGGYGFFDKLDSPDGYLYSQGTLGVEALSINNDARVNVYIPQSTVHGVHGGGQVEIVGNQIGIASSMERALPGEDFELGQKLPFNFADVRVYGGGYRYTADNFGIVAGPRGRLELTLNDQYIPQIPWGAEITVGGEIEHDDTRGTQSFALLKLKIPFGGAVHDTTSTLDQRMNNFIVRDIDVVEKSGNGDSGGLQPVEANGVTLTSVAAASSTNNLATTINAASTNSLILVNGGGGNVATGGTVTLKSGQTVLGSGGTVVLTAANTGTTYNYTYAGAVPTVAGGGSDSIVMANNTQFNNLNFTGVLAMNISGSHAVTIANVSLASPSAGLFINGASNVAISNLTVTNPQYGILLESNNSNISIANTQINNPTIAGIETTSGSINNLLIANTQVNNATSVAIDMSSGAITNLSIANTQANNAGSYGFYLNGDTITNFTYNNSQTNNGAGIGISFMNSPIAALSGSGNSSTGNITSNCSHSGGAITGSLTYNTSSTCP